MVPCFISDPWCFSTLDGLNLLRTSWDWLFPPFTGVHLSQVRCEMDLVHPQKVSLFLERKNAEATPRNLQPPIANDAAWCKSKQMTASTGLGTKGMQRQAAIDLFGRDSNIEKATETDLISSHFKLCSSGSEHAKAAVCPAETAVCSGLARKQRHSVPSNKSVQAIF